MASCSGSNFGTIWISASAARTGAAAFVAPPIASEEDSIAERRACVSENQRRETTDALHEVRTKSRLNRGELVGCAEVRLALGAAQL